MTHALVQIGYTLAAIFFGLLSIICFKAFWETLMKGPRP